MVRNRGRAKYTLKERMLLELVDNCMASQTAGNAVPVALGDAIARFIAKHVTAV